jgi:hypothetical protein
MPQVKVADLPVRFNSMPVDMIGHQNAPASITHAKASRTDRATSNWKKEKQLIFALLQRTRAWFKHRGPKVVVLSTVEKSAFRPATYAVGWLSSAPGVVSWLSGRDEILGAINKAGGPVMVRANSSLISLSGVLREHQFSAAQQPDRLHAYYGTDGQTPTTFDRHMLRGGSMLVSAANAAKLRGAREVRTHGVGPDERNILATFCAKVGLVLGPEV